MFEDGVDVVYHMAEESAAGLFQAAKDYSEATGDDAWAIGVDADQNVTAGEEYQPYILTSMITRYDVAVFGIIQAAQEGNFRRGLRMFDLSVGAVGYSESGGYPDDVADQLDDLEAQIISGAIVVSQ